MNKLNYTTRGFFSFFSRVNRSKRKEEYLPIQFVQREMTIEEEVDELKKRHK